MKYLIIICFGFLAQFVDAIAGGGGLISIPALLTARLPAHFALGTNKFGAAFGTMASARVFIKDKKVNLSLIKYWIFFSAIGAFIGVKTVVSIQTEVLNILVAVMLLIVCLYTIVKKDFGYENKNKVITHFMIFQGMIISFSLGFYDGFFGPGTGSFLIFIFIHLFGFDFLMASGHAKLLNLSSCLASLVVFLFYGKVLIVEGIILGISMFIGGQIGSKIAIKKGVKLVKPIFICVSIAFIIKLLYEFLSL